MVRVLLTLLLGLVAGCSWNTYSNGKYGEVLTSKVSRETIVARLGPPTSTEYIVDGPPYHGKPRSGVLLTVDRYYTKERIADINKGSGTGELAGMTLGVSELFYAPYALLDHYIPRTRQLKLTYEKDDTLRGYELSNRKP